MYYYMVILVSTSLKVWGFACTHLGARFSLSQSLCSVF